MANGAFIIGLTGSIGMGKTTVAGQLEWLGARVCSADAIVHRLLARGGKGVQPVSRVFPSVLKDGAIDRKLLGVIVFNDGDKRKQLERILHPMVIAEENRFIASQRRKGARLIVLDIPLLFETGGQKRCHLTLVASAPFFLQRQRVLRRPGMTEEMFGHILRAQMPDRIKRRLADAVVRTGLGKWYSFRQLATIIRSMQ